MCGCCCFGGGCLFYVSQPSAHLHRRAVNLQLLIGDWAGGIEPGKHWRQGHCQSCLLPLLSSTISSPAPSLPLSCFLFLSPLFCLLVIFPSGTSGPLDHQLIEHLLHPSSAREQNLIRELADPKTDGLGRCWCY